MLITKEQQEAWVNAYIKENHTQEESNGFVDGVNKTLSAINHHLTNRITEGEQLKLTSDELLEEYAKIYHEIEIKKLGLIESEFEQIISNVISMAQMGRHGDDIMKTSLEQINVALRLCNK